MGRRFDFTDGVKAGRRDTGEGTWGLSPGHSVWRLLFVLTDGDLLAKRDGGLVIVSSGDRSLRTDGAEEQDKTQSWFCWQCELC